MSKQQLDQKRYYTDKNGTYYDRCRVAHELTSQRCVICFGKSKHIHHSSYGKDIHGYSIFPVCEKCHYGVCHASNNWIEKTDRMKSENTSEFREYLRMQYLLVKIVHVPIHGKLSYKKRK